MRARRRTSLLAQAIPNLPSQQLNRRLAFFPPVHPGPAPIRGGSETVNFFPWLVLLGEKGRKDALPAIPFPM